MIEPLRSIRYRGGKAKHARWIAKRLPVTSVYVEPCAGMLSVLLARPKAKNEIVNDLDGRIADFWRAVRDEPDELARLLAATPHAEASVREADEVLADPDVSLVRRAWAVATVLAQGFAADIRSKTQWLQPYPTGAPELAASVRRLPDRIQPLANRIAAVSIFDRDCVNILERYVPLGNATIYFDPPYAEGRGYNELGSSDVFLPFDVEAVGSLLRNAEAKVAVSGYDSCPWDELLDVGWVRSERTSFQGMKQTKVTECLWTNYEPTNIDPSLGQNTLAL